MTFVAISNNALMIVECDSKANAEQVFGYGNVFESKEHAEKVLKDRTEPKRHLTDRERKQLEIDQWFFAMNQMGINGKEFEKRKDAFFKRLDRTYRVQYD